MDIELQENDDVQKAMESARSFVEFNHKLNGFNTEIELQNEITNGQRLIS